MLQSPSIGLVGLSVYHPGQSLPQSLAPIIAEEIRGTRLPVEYAHHIERTLTWPGSVIFLPDSTQVVGRRFPLDPNSIDGKRMTGQDAEAMAVCMLLASGDTQKTDVDLIIGTQTQGSELIPLYSSSLLNMMQSTVNIGNTSSSFLTKLLTATNMVASGSYRRIIIAASHSADPSQPNSADCAVAAMICVAEPECGMIGWTSENFNEVRIPSPNSSPSRGLSPRPITYSPVLSRDSSPSIEILDDPVFHALGECTTKSCQRIFNKIYTQTNITGDRIASAVSHSPIDWAPSLFCKNAGIPVSRLYEPQLELTDKGCCGLPSNLFDAVTSGHVKVGENLLLFSRTSKPSLETMIIKPTLWLFNNVLSQAL
ncbi:hypothetical protein Pelo_7288 [Pelomyxa schiedti]|nr:hypothetical protein Pelo_7288 [Pelomyxa schiedti]